MRGTIESIEERKTKKGKPYHLVKIDGEAYWVWEAGLIKNVSRGSFVEFESEGDEYPKITNLTECETGVFPNASPTKQVSKYDDTKVWNTCLMCAKDIMVALINSDRLPKQASPITEIKAIAIDMAKAFYQASENGVVEEDETDTMPWMSKTPPEEKPPPKAGTTFDSLNYQIINTKWANKEELAGWWADMQGSMLKMTEDERGKLIKTYSSELGKIK